MQSGVGVELTRTAAASNTFSLYVSDDQLSMCERLLREPVPMRIVALKHAMMFHTVAPNTSAVREDYMTSKRGRIKEDMFQSAFNMTWGGDKGRAVDPEFKTLIGLFMMDAMVALDAWGFVPWSMRLVKSNSGAGERTWRVPEVPLRGLWRVRQSRLSDSPMTVVYKLEPNSKVTYSGEAMPIPALLNNRDIEQFVESQSERLDAGKRANPPKRDTNMPASYVPGAVSNQAHDYGAIENPRATRGVYVLKRPAIDGTLSSSAMSVLGLAQMLSINEFFNLLANARNSDRMLVTEGTNDGGSSNRVSAASSLIESNDVARNTQRLLYHKNAVARAYNRSDDAAQAQEITNKGSAASPNVGTIFSPLAGRALPAFTRPAFDGNRYDLQPGRRIVNAPESKAPASLDKDRTYFGEQIAAAFGISYEMAFGRGGKIAAKSAEVTQSAADRVVEMNGSILALITQYILNQLYNETHTAELADTISAKRKRLETEQEPDEIAAIEEQIAALGELMQMPSRFTITFPTKAPPVDEVIKLADRGVLSRASEAAMLGASLGIHSDAMEIQQGPNKYQKATTEMQAKAKAKASPAKPGGAKPASSK